MTNGFFTLELDTTGPNINIYMPNYTATSIETEIVIQSNEKLSEYQEIYILDSNRKRHDLIFEYHGDYLLGKLVMNNISIGIATIYARLKDDVNNLSNIAYKSFLLEDSTDLQLEIKEYSLNPIVGTKIKNVLDINKSKIVNTNEINKEIIEREYIRNINEITSKVGD